MRDALAASLIVLAVAAPAQVPGIEAAPLRLSFIGAAGASLPSQTVQVRQVGRSPVHWQAQGSAPWILLSTTSGSGDAALQIGVDARALAPGRYEGRVTLTGPTGPPPVVVTVVLQLQGRREGSRARDSSAALSLSSPPGSREPASSELVLDSAEGAPSSFRAKPDQPWLTVDPTSGSVPARLVVAARPQGLTPGEHRATVILTDEEGDPWLRVPVVYTVARERETLSIAGDMLPPATRGLPYAQAIPIGGGTPPYSIRIVEGRLPQGLVLAGGAISGVTRFSGSYPLVVAVSDASTPPVTVTQPLLLQVIVLYQDTALVVSPPSLTLTVGANQRSPGARLAIGSGRQPLAWRAETDAAWLRLTPDRGMSPGLLQLDIDSAALKPGTYAATVTVTMAGAPNSPARIPVQVEIRR